MPGLRAIDKVGHTLHWRAGLRPALGVPTLGAPQDRNTPSRLASSKRAGGPRAGLCHWPWSGPGGRIRSRSGNFSRLRLPLFRRFGLAAAREPPMLRSCARPMSVPRQSGDFTCNSLLMVAALSAACGRGSRRRRHPAPNRPRRGLRPRCRSRFWTRGGRRLRPRAIR